MEEITDQSVGSKPEQQTIKSVTVKNPIGITLVSIYLFASGFLCIGWAALFAIATAVGGDSGPSPADISSANRFILVMALLLLCFWGIGWGMALRKKWSKIPAIILSFISISLGFLGVITIPLSIAGIVAVSYLFSFKGDWKR